MNHSVMIVNVISVHFTVISNSTAEFQVNDCVGYSEHVFADSLAFWEMMYLNTCHVNPL